jgi:hypothetical protein
MQQQIPSEQMTEENAQRCVEVGWMYDVASDDELARIFRLPNLQCGDAEWNASDKNLQCEYLLGN